MEPPKKDYEVAIDAYVEAEKEYRTFENALLDGDLAVELAQKAGPTPDPDWIRREYQSYVAMLKLKLEDLNIKLQDAKNAFRQAVQLNPTQWRGPDGAASSRAYGPLTASSVTSRFFDAESLLKLADRHGILGRLLSLTNFDKNGKEYPLVQSKWEIDYDHVYKWLKEQNLQVVIDGSYDEKEGTPRITGAKPLAFMGQKLDK